MAEMIKCKSGPYMDCYSSWVLGNVNSYVSSFYVCLSNSVRTPETILVTLGRIRLGISQQGKVVFVILLFSRGPHLDHRFSRCDA